MRFHTYAHCRTPAVTRTHTLSPRTRTTTVTPRFFGYARVSPFHRFCGFHTVLPRGCRTLVASAFGLRFACLPLPRFYGSLRVYTAWLYHTTVGYGFCLTFSHAHFRSTCCTFTRVAVWLQVCATFVWFPRSAAFWLPVTWFTLVRVVYVAVAVTVCTLPFGFQFRYHGLYHTAITVHMVYVPLLPVHTGCLRIRLVVALVCLPPRACCKHTACTTPTVAAHVLRFTCGPVCTLRSRFLHYAFAVWLLLRFAAAHFTCYIRLRSLLVTFARLLPFTHLVGYAHATRARLDFRCIVAAPVCWFTAYTFAFGSAFHATGTRVRFWLRYCITGYNTTHCRYSFVVIYCCCCCWLHWYILLLLLRYDVVVDYVVVVVVDVIRSIVFVTLHAFGSTLR